MPSAWKINSESARDAPHTVGRHGAVVERRRARRQHDAPHPRLDAFGEHRAPVHEADAVVADVAGRDSDLAVEDGLHAVLAADADLCVRMKAAVDEVVVNLDLGIPSIDELREVRECDPVHAQLRDETLPVALRRELDEELLHAHRIGGRHVLEHGRVVLAGVAPRERLTRRVGVEVPRPRREAPAHGALLVARERADWLLGNDGRSVRSGEPFGGQRLRRLR